MAAKSSQPNQELTVKRLKNRADFLKARDGARSHERAFVLQLRQRSVDLESDDSLRVGFTVTKKVGNAVHRNRVKRRLREALRLADLPSSCRGKDAVLIARPSALTLPFESLITDISHGLRHAKMSDKSGNKVKQRKHRVANRS